MGAACCVSAKDRTIVSRFPGETLQRHTRYSPNWSFRWDNRGRVAGEETPTNWLQGGVNIPMEIKSRTIVDPAFAPEDGSPLNSSQSPPVQKPHFPSAGNTGILRLQSDPAILQNNVEVKESLDSPLVSYPSSIKPSPSVSSMPSMATSSPSSQIIPSNTTPSRWHRCSPGHRLLRQVSDSRIPGYKSPTLSISEEPSFFQPPAWGNESARVSNGGSPDCWSIPTFPEIMTTRRERWSFDSEASGFSWEKITRSSGHHSGSPFNIQTCGICTKLITEKSVWGCASQKIMSNNEVAVVAVLICGHVYHAECLECITPEINKYDPDCPVCSYGEKRVVKMSEKALKAELNAKARKRSRRRIIDGDFSSDGLDHHKGSFNERGPRMSSSSSTSTSTIGKPFLRRHFSFASRTTNKPVPESQSSLRRSFFWTRSTKN